MIIFRLTESKNYHFYIRDILQYITWRFIAMQKKLKKKKSKKQKTTTFLLQISMLEGKENNKYDVKEVKIKIFDICIFQTF